MASFCLHFLFLLSPGSVYLPIISADHADSPSEKVVSARPSLTNPPNEMALGRMVRAKQEPKKKREKENESVKGAR